ncbi:hypothetical protein [Sphingobium sp. DN12]|uniref:hypothetical protein n=1 Tax=Sphingobium sp. DN12 TaxID=3378073 RepID=UPI003DA67699
MAKVKIKVTREKNASAKRALVLIDDRVLRFKNSDEINVMVEAGDEHGITLYCEGPKGASATVKVEKAGGKVIEPLKATVKTDYGVTHSSDVFKVDAA